MLEKAQQAPFRILAQPCIGLCFIALLFGSVVAPAHARPLDPHFVHLTTADGLSHAIVYCILQDRYGFMWFGTHDGLSRYDGYAFTVYHHRRSDPASLAHNTVNTLYEDRAGTLWVGTVGGLDSFTQDADGFLWVGTVGSGLFRYDLSTGQAQAYRHDPADPYSLSDDNVLALYEDRAGTLWVGTLYGGLNRLDRAGGQFTVYTVEDGLPNDAVSSILPDEEGHLWLGTMGGGLSRFNPQTGVFRNYDAGDGLQGEHFTIVRPIAALTARCSSVA